jgi:hypothetical protein
MAHPYHEHMDHKKQKSRVSHIAHHYAHGGAVHGDEKEDKALIRKEVKSSALKHEHKTHKADGGAVAPRQDKVARRARGGKVGHKGKGHTSVNVIVAPQQGAWCCAAWWWNASRCNGRPSPDASRRRHASSGHDAASRAWRAHLRSRRRN